MSSHGLAPLRDAAWLPVRPNFALGAFCVGTFLKHETYSGHTVVKLRAPQGPAQDRVFFVNGPTPIAANTHGVALMATDRPVLAKCELNSTFTAYGAGCPFGPINSDGKLYPGIPGFRLLEDVASTSTHPDGICLVARDFTGGNYWAKATTNWQDRWGPCPYISAQPSIDHCGGEVYDGSETYRPNLTYTIFLPRGGTQCDGGDSSWQVGDPNLRTGNLFQYTFNSSGNNGRPLVGVNYLDDRIGTVRMMNFVSGSGYPITPQGWLYMDGTVNSVGNGGSGIDMRGFFPVGHDNRGASGPAYSDQTYATIGAAPTIGVDVTTVAGTKMSSGGVPAGHGGAGRPPCKALVFIERVA